MEGMDNQYPMNGQVGGDGGKGMAIASMILGIVSIVLCCIWYISVTSAIVGIVLGILHNKKNGRCGMSTAGIVCSIIGIVITVALIIFVTVLGVAALSGLEALEGSAM